MCGWLSTRRHHYMSKEAVFCFYGYEGTNAIKLQDHGDSCYSCHQLVNNRKGAKGRADIISMVISAASPGSCNFTLSRDHRSIPCRSLGGGEDGHMHSKVGVMQERCLPVSQTSEQNPWLEGEITASAQNLKKVKLKGILSLFF